MTRWATSSDRFFSPDPTQRRIARSLYESVARLPIIFPFCLPHRHKTPAYSQQK